MRVRSVLIALGTSLAALTTQVAAQRTAAPPPLLDSLAFRPGAPDHPLFPLRPGMTWVYAIRDGGETLLDSITVLSERRRVGGVTATVVLDRVRRGAVVVEETYDWYARDTAGTVWYLGEATNEFRAGRAPSRAGSWEAGVAGARAGIMMPARPRAGGAAYYQEYRRGVAEDMGRVTAVNATVAVRAGRFTGCVVTEDWSPLERSVREEKTYCPNVGLVRERTVAGGSEQSELIAVRRP